MATQGIDAPVGEVYFGAENPKGELGFYINSRGGGVPYRMKIRSPSFCNLSILSETLPGHMTSDVPAILGSLDFVMGRARTGSWERSCEHAARFRNRGGTAYGGKAVEPGRGVPILPGMLLRPSSSWPLVALVPRLSRPGSPPTARVTRRPVKDGRFRLRGHPGSSR